jgi:hypothetical protein
MGAICREPSFDATCGVLSDYRAVVIGPSRAVVKGMVAGLSRWPVLACVRRANLPGPEHENVYGMARMFEILAALHGVGKVSTFKSEDEAVAWLLQESSG